MKHALQFLAFGLLLTTGTWAQRIIATEQDERRLWLEVGVGPGFLKAGSAYTIKPLFLTKAGVGWQVFVAPYYKVNERFKIGLKLGGVFRPKFEDIESNSIIQPKFTSYGLMTADFFLTPAYRSWGAPATTRSYVGLNAGVSYFGKLEARDLVTQQVYELRRHGREVFVAIAPKLGIVIGEIKLEIEHMITTPFNPDFTSFTISTGIPLGVSRYY
ncbi:hypothetical protein [Runella slithyformis]|uniref:Outer membrane protein beta-barrel domain-containing protein n=1 Tax=Runella slithyformis (strain ATCC 29530 / DSM 19594 / LMG 11500 / NCIMB 11436 / LSU 4) TaxID=761193 RepID=A0A7U3ZKI1_RUNSL|nr:hypothetical protein [Runella slithyformis]AEI48889.1 hypothetical protein Runsl_2485 [Runella slithyformis DSM 19594]